MTMEFYDDIDVEFGDSKSFAELLKIAEGDCAKNNNDKESHTENEISTEVVVWEDEVEDEGEVYLYRDCEYYNQLNEDISLDVLEVNGDDFHNEPLEERYKKENCIKPKRKSKLPKKVPIANGTSKILKKAELRKEMMGGDISSDNIVKFQKKKNNAFLNSLGNTPATVNSESEETSEPHMDPVKKERTQKWIMKLNSSEDEYYTAQSSSTSNYLSTSASTSDNDTPRKYRATSQRFRKKTALATSTNEGDDALNVSATSNSISSKSQLNSDDSVGFNSMSVNSTPVTSNPPPKKTEKKKKTVSTYRPVLYQHDFKLDPKEFPAI